MFIEKLWKFLAPEGVATAAAADTGAATGAETGAPAKPAVIPADGSVDAADTGDTAAEHDLESMSPNSPEYREWQLKGKLPKKSAKVLSEAADSTTAEDEETEETLAEGEESLTSSAETAAESQTAPKLQKGKKGAERFKELVELVRTKDAELAELRKPKDTAVARAESQPAAAAELLEPGMDDVDSKTGKPLYKTIGEYNTARDKWLLDTFDKRTEDRQKTKMSQDQAREVNDRFRNRLEKAREVHPDFDQVALSEKLNIPKGSGMEAAIVLSEHGAEMSYLLGKNPAEADRIAKLPGFEQAREMFMLELIAGGWDGLAKDPRFASKLVASAKPKKITAVTSIPHEVGGTGQVLPDEVEQAAIESESDPQAVARFIAADTRRAIARRKGR